MTTGTAITKPVSPSITHAQDVVRAAQQELDHLLRQRTTLMRRIGTVKQTLSYLANAFGEDVLTPELLRALGRSKPRKQPGFTQTCRIILKEAATPLEAWQGWWELRRRAPQLVEHLKAPLASVTTVFNRLVASGEARSFPNGKGRRVWEWIGNPNKE